MQEQNAIQTMIAMIAMKHQIYVSRISKNKNSKNLKMYYLQWRDAFVLSLDVCLEFIVTRCRVIKISQKRTLRLYRIGWSVRLLKVGITIHSIYNPM